MPEELGEGELESETFLVRVLRQAGAESRGFLGLEDFAWREVAFVGLGRRKNKKEEV